MQSPIWNRNVRLVDRVRGFVTFRCDWQSKRDNVDVCDKRVPQQSAGRERWLGVWTQTAPQVDGRPTPAGCLHTKCLVWQATFPELAWVSCCTGQIAQEDERLAATTNYLYSVVSGYSNLTTKQLTHSHSHTQRLLVHSRAERCRRHRSVLVADGPATGAHRFSASACHSRPWE